MEGAVNYVLEGYKTLYVQLSPESQAEFKRDSITLFLRLLDEINRYQGDEVKP